MKKKVSGTLQVGFDVSGLDPNFKEHAQRGIGRYVRELKNHFDKVSPQRLEAQAQVGYFAHLARKGFDSFHVVWLAAGGRL